MMELVAQNGTGFTSNGYYRICNLVTKRYIYVTDNKDYYNPNTDSEDFQAIQLWKDLSRTVSNPASVIYIEEVSSGSYDLKAQGTGVHALTGYYVNVSKQANGTYKVSASVKKGGMTATKTLTDKSHGSGDKGKLGTGTNNDGSYLYWIVDKMETNHATNYFGITPTIELNGMYYQPFFAAFPFKPVSPDMNIYYIERVEGNSAIMKKIEGEVPASTPVLIECTSTDPSQNRLELLNSSNVKVTGNKLSGIYFCNGDRPEESTSAYTEFNSSTMRVFSVADGKLVLTNDAPERLQIVDALDWDTYEDIEINCVPANTSYMKADAATPEELEVCLNGMGIDDIIKGSSKDVKGVYTISGTHLRSSNDIEGLPAGLYIVAGKKVVIK